MIDLTTPPTVVQPDIDPERRLRTLDDLAWLEQHADRLEQIRGSDVGPLAARALRELVGEMRLLGVTTAEELEDRRAALMGFSTVVSVESAAFGDDPF